MTDPISTFLKRLEAVRLTSNERLQMRERLALYADMHGAVVPASPVGGFFALLASRRFSTYAGALVVVLVAASSVALGAEGSVPGDALYAVKTDVNEPLMTAFAATPAGQAQVAADIATRRIDEAVTLASRGELTPAKQTYLTAEFNHRVAVANRKASELAQIDAVAADDVKASFAANLAGEAQALGAITAKSPDGGKELLSVLVATSENVSDSADATDIELAAGTSDATSSPAEAALPVRASVMRAAALAPSATTTASTTERALRTALTGRFSKRLRITASTTLEARFASSTLKAARFLMPRIDVAIPARPAEPSSVTETGNADGLELDVNE